MRWWGLSLRVRTATTWDKTLDGIQTHGLIGTDLSHELSLGRFCSGSLIILQELIFPKLVPVSTIVHNRDSCVEDGYHQGINCHTSCVRISSDLTRTLVSSCVITMSSHETNEFKVRQEERKSRSGSRRISREMLCHKRPIKSEVKLSKRKASWGSSLRSVFGNQE